MTPPLASHSQLSQNWKCYQVSQLEIEFAGMKNVCGIVHAHVGRQEDHNSKEIKPLIAHLRITFRCPAFFQIETGK